MDGEQLIGCLGVGMEVEGGCDYKGISRGELGGDGTVLNPDLGGGYRNPHVKFHGFVPPSSNIKFTV